LGGSLFADIRGLFDPTVTGFTYNKVTVKKKSVQKQVVTVEVVNNGNTNTIQLSEKEWAAAESGCAVGNVPQGIKQKLGISGASVQRAPARMAAVEFDEADLNGDGRDDHVKVAFPTNGLIVELTTAAGTLAPRVSYATGANPRSVLLGDFNKDGRLDAAVAFAGAVGQNNGGVSVLLGIGDGTFRAAANYAGGGSAVGIGSGDFNGDGNLDLVAVKEAGVVSVLIGVGDGSFRAAVDYLAESGAASVLAADFTGDGRLDLAVANQDRDTVSIFVGSGTGTFSAAVRNVVGAAPAYLGAIDANLDGRWDLVVLHRQSATISMWLGQASGQLSFVNRVLSGLDYNAFTIVQYESDPPMVLAPDAARQRMLIHGIADDGRLSGEAAFLVGVGARAIVAGDFNGDRRLDLVTNDGGARLSILLGRAGGGFSDPQTVTLESAAASLASADLNGDGRADLAVSLGTRIAILYGQTNGSFAAGPSLLTTSRAEKVLIVDVDGDGRLDVVSIHSASNSVDIHYSSPGGTFAAAARLSTPGTPVAAAIGDLNGDGRIDAAAIYTSATTATLQVYLRNADGSLRLPPPVPLGVSATSLVMGDFTGDGKMDLAYAGLLENSPNFLYRVAVLPGNGDGTYGNRILTNSGDFPVDLVTADFDKDGKADLLAAHCCGTSDLSRLYGNGDGSFRLQYLPGGSDPTAMVSGDFDGDGRTDTAVLNAPFGARTNSVVWVLTNPEPLLLNTSAASGQVQLLAPDSIATAYGSGLASAAAVAPTPNWPTTLSGASVSIRDFEGRTHAGRIYFASPGQINYLIPPEVSDGFALVTVNAPGGRKQEGVIRVSRVAPAVFYAGTGIAASALLIRAKADGTQELEQTVLVTNQGQVVARGLTLGPEGEQEVLLAFGTGIRLRTALERVTATIGGVAAPVLYAGPQNEYPGLDQVNILLPKSLRGRGIVDVVISVDGAVANRVRIRVN
jgi:uncharacterized protein (TIGR03437 family)